MTSAEDAIVPFQLAVPECELDDLRRRLAATRWPDREPVGDWTQGVPLAAQQALVAYWRDHYDWGRCQARLNAFGQYRTTIDGVGIHFLHVRSPEPAAMPLLLTHGWPGSVIEFADAIPLLTDPVANGGRAEDAFHVVVPSLPGYGFSDQPVEAGWGIPRIAAAWTVLMARLGYDRWVAQGGDWGAGVTTALGVMKPAGLAAIHVNLPLVVPNPLPAEPTPREAATLKQLAYYRDWDAGYSTQQMTRPQTLGYGLADSPAGQAAWIYEKFWAWTDCRGEPRNALSFDQMLDNIMLYWLPNAAASSARLYWESFRGGFGAVELDLPTGISVFPHDIYSPPREWAERCVHNLIHWHELDHGGHFAAFEQPALFVDELRACFAHVR